MKKYKFTGEILEYNGTTLRRIRRLSDGLIGGWIESEDNLSHEGTCFVYDNAEVYGNAKVYGNSWVYGKARVYGSAQVYDNAQVFGNAWVCRSAKVFGNALVHGLAIVFGDTEVYGSAQVYGNAQVRKSPLFTNAHKHRITMTETHIFIGCEGHTKEYWKANINQIAKEYKYSKKELKGLKMILNAMLYQQKLNG